MARDGSATKEKILLKSREILFLKGYAGMRIDDILKETGITKGAFFHHFKSKQALAEALIDQYVSEDLAHLELSLEAAYSKHDDALQQLLYFIQIFVDELCNIGSNAPSCLYASYLHEPSHFDAKTLKKISGSILEWRKALKGLFTNVLKDYDMKWEKDLDSLADHTIVIFEGAFILARALESPDAISAQLKHLKNYYKLLFVKKQ